MASLSNTGRRIDANAVLLIHNAEHPCPPDVVESVRAFRRHSRFPVLSVNASFGVPPGLRAMRFSAIVLHYTMFYAGFAPLTPPYLDLLDRLRGAHVTAMFQDEQTMLRERRELLSNYGIDCVYTCFRRREAEHVYGSPGRRVVSYLPGYVGERLVAAAASVGAPDQSGRPIDIGYRGRRPAEDWSGAAREKYEIATRFTERAGQLALALDIETDESKRIYGDRWLRFIADCKAVLGTESGADVCLPDTGEAIPYRTVSPRHFEAAALGATQILYEGEYAGVLEADTHYIPLRKDFANFDEAIERFRDAATRAEIAASARADLIDSGRYGYGEFVAGFDRALTEAGLEPPTDRDAIMRAAARRLYPSRPRRRLAAGARALKTGTRVALNRLRGRAPTDSLRRGRSV